MRRQQYTTTQNLPRVVWESSRVARAEIKRASIAGADKDGGSGGAVVEVQPFLRLGVLAELDKQQTIRHDTTRKVNSHSDASASREDLPV